MTVPGSDVRLFIGSSSEGKAVARNLHAALGDACLVDVWNQGVFEPGGNALDSLIAVSKRVDFAVLVATPDDTTVSRGVESPSARDNIVLEYGLFAGALGRDRVYLLATDDIRFPTDLLGVTRLTYRARADNNLRAAVDEAGLQIESMIQRLGPLDRNPVSRSEAFPDSPLERELAVLRDNAAAQGWTVKTDSETTLRLLSPRGTTHTLRKGRPASTRGELRGFVRELKANGMRVNSSIQRSVDESPFSVG